MNQTEIKELNKNVLGKSLVIGFCGGVIWSALFILLYVLNIIEINPMLIIQSVIGELAWLEKWYAYGVLLFTIGILSVLIAIVYYFSLKKWRAWGVGASYGVIWWLLLIVFLPFIIQGFHANVSFSFETYVATFCVFLLYGTFIGYSISFEYDNAIKK